MSIPVFIDSGSSYSLIRKQLAKKFSHKFQTGKPLKLICANGENVQPNSYLYLNIKLGHRTFNHKFYILDKLAFPLIIGTDLMKKSDMVIHQRGDSFWFHSEPDKTYSMDRMRNKFVFMMTEANQIKDNAPTTTERVQQLLAKYPEVCSKNGSYGKTNLITHSIELEDDVPTTVRPIRYPPTYANEIRKQIKALLDDGRIRQSNSPYSANIVLAPKKDNKIRMTVSYKKLNAKTIADATPIHKGQNILKNLPKGGYFSVIDLKSGFWQIMMNPKDISKTAFQFDGTLYEFLVMPFGLKNSTATFVRLMNKVLGETIGKFTEPYVDDIIVFSNTFEEHLKHLEDVLVRLQNAGLTINLEKSVFAKREINFLGHLVTGSGIKMQPEKIRAIVDWPVPECKEDVHRFIGTCSWYRDFIHDFSTISEPLVRLLRKNFQFKWSCEQEDSFSLLKDRICNDVVLATIDYSYPIILKTDASNVGLGAVLCQIIDGVERVIAFGSKLLNPSEQKLHIYQKELLAIMWAVEKYKEYIVGETFSIVTDNSAVSYLSRLKDTDSKVARWASRIEPYLDRIVHRPGRENTVADALSRAPVSGTEEDENLMEDPEEIFVPLCSLFDHIDDVHRVKEEQKKDELICRIVAALPVDKQLSE